MIYDKCKIIDQQQSGKYLQKNTNNILIKYNIEQTIIYCLKQHPSQKIRFHTSNPIMFAPMKQINLTSCKSHLLQEMRVLKFVGQQYLIEGQMILPSYEGAKDYSISAEGLQALLTRTVDPNYPHKNVTWTDDIRVELPIKLAKSGVAASKPTTLIDEFQQVVQTMGQRKALSSKINGKWVSINFIEYYERSISFAKAMIAFKFQEFTSVNIIGFNAPEWCFAFYGSLFCRCLPIGVYTTNNVAACEYIATHSSAKLILAQNREQAQKYYNLLGNGSIDVIVIYNDPDYKQDKYPNKVIQYQRFIAEGQRVDLKFVEKRMSQVKPGQCCTLVYTSGTTGMPKGVMLSHDNYIWTKRALDAFHTRDKDQTFTIVSYLPLSHVAAQFSDIVSSMMEGIQVFFADPSALQGTLIQTLQEVRPKIFFSVPRVWEKIYDKMMEIAKENGYIKGKIATWAKSIGPEGTLNQSRQQPTTWQFKLAKMLVYNNVKKALGLDQCQYFFFGAAPLDPSVRAYFLSLNFYLINSYGMSQSTGPQNFTDKTSLKINSGPEAYRQVGRCLPGTELTIIKSKSEEAQDEGQICYRGRNTFMGYFRNPEQTAKTIDGNGFLHSGDNGKITKDGILFITGRAKELIITAGGENIPPVLIENEIRAVMPFAANFMLVGDMKKFLLVLITLREDPPGSGTLDKASREYLLDRGCDVKTVSQARNHERLKKIIGQALKKANEKAISRAQHVQDFLVLPEDFTVDNGLLTPTMKLKRKQVLKKYAAEIDTAYNKPGL